MVEKITDWDDAYANADHIPGADEFIKNWSLSAGKFRKKLDAENRTVFNIEYAGGPRNKLDLFLPSGAPKGLIIFVHGGYWYRFDKNYWSHLSAGPLAHGWAVAMPSYSLCPEVSIQQITHEIGDAIEVIAGDFDGPIRLAGHSAGGHLVTRMVCQSTPLSPLMRSRIEHVMAISPVSDLRPLLKIRLNETLKISQEQAELESPALLQPLDDTKLTCWVGAAERPEFIRQNALLANIWLGLGAEVAHMEEPGKHHFNVIEGLTNPDSDMVKQLLA